MHNLAARPSPHEAYRKIALDARIEGASGPQLTQICFEEAIIAIDGAARAAARGDAPARNGALGRAFSIIVTLRRSVSDSHEISTALKDFYDGAATLLRAMQREHDASALANLRRDLVEIAQAIFVQKAA